MTKTEKENRRKGSWIWHSANSLHTVIYKESTFEMTLNVIYWMLMTAQQQKIMELGWI